MNFGNHTWPVLVKSQLIINFLEALSGALHICNRSNAVRYRCIQRYSALYRLFQGSAALFRCIQSSAAVYRCIQ